MFVFTYAYILASTHCLFKYRNTKIAALDNYMIGSSARSVLENSSCKLAGIDPGISYYGDFAPFAPDWISCKQGNERRYEYGKRGFSYNGIGIEKISGMFFIDMKTTIKEIESISNDISMKLGPPDTKKTLPQPNGDGEYFTWKKGKILAEMIYRTGDECSSDNEMHIYIYHNSEKEVAENFGEKKEWWRNTYCDGKSEIENTNLKESSTSD